MEAKFNRIQELCPGFDYWQLYYDSLKCYMYEVKDVVYPNNNIIYHPLMDFTIKRLDRIRLECNAEDYKEEPEIRVYQEGIYDIIDPSLWKAFGITSPVDYFLEKLEYIKNCKEYALYKLGNIPEGKLIYNINTTTIEEIYSGPDAYHVFIGLCYLRQGHRRSFKYYNCPKPYIVGLEHYFTFDS
jgi:hypothetical protein